MSQKSQGKWVKFEQNEAYVRRDPIGTLQIAFRFELFQNLDKVFASGFSGTRHFTVVLEKNGIAECLPISCQGHTRRVLVLNLSVIGFDEQDQPPTVPPISLFKDN